ncbi:integrin beta-1-like [Diabrotica virgifera virgifera]|uniref:Integrin beta-like protein 1 n=1 Tax=Diabrotica virgifera virgifera TaxID=50390 RepID=A0ABM5KJZ6_DIAVI|nr:integrin beta-1-like [Diabrotica virgifera virgifera]
MLSQGAIFLLILVTVISGQSSPCYISDTCKECIQNPGCAWCVNPLDITGRQAPHCRPDTDTSDLTCWKTSKYCDCDLKADLCVQEESNEVCSGAGICECGKCACNEIPRGYGQRYYGKYCQCDNFSCKRANGLLCSNRGRCNCSRCDCFPGYTGDACECETAESNCRPSSDDDICSNNGICVCNRCKCKKGYSGKYCEECLSCEVKRCSDLRDCVECQAYKSGKLKDTCDTSCTEFQTQVVHVVHELESQDVNNVKKCRIIDDESCLIIFDVFYIEDNKLIVRALDQKVCRKTFW